MSFLFCFRKCAALYRVPFYALANRVNSPSANSRSRLANRYFCETIMENEVIFEDLQQHLKNDAVVLIDVRGPEEIEQAGKIDKSINIPLGKVKEALLLNNEDFENIYKAKKPSATDKIVMHCHAGKRAIMAADIAKELGLNAIPYKGSFTDWVAKGGPVSH